MGIITISRTPGSGGDAIAKTLAKRQNMTLLDKNLVKEWFLNNEPFNLDLERFDEHHPSFSQRSERQKLLYINGLKELVYSYAIHKNLIVMGRGGQYILGGFANVLNIRLTCSEEKGFAYLKENNLAGVKSMKDYLKLLNDRRGFYKFFFHQLPNQESFYDAIINTDRIETQRAVDLIEEMQKNYFTGCYSKRCIDIADDDDSESIAELYLAQRIKNRILFRENLPIDHFEVLAKGKVITFKGAVTSDAFIKHCTDIAREEGATQVESFLYIYSPTIYNW